MWLIIWEGREDLFWQRQRSFLLSIKSNPWKLSSKLITSPISLWPAEMVEANLLQESCFQLEAVGSPPYTVSITFRVGITGGIKIQRLWSQDLQGHYIVTTVSFTLFAVNSAKRWGTRRVRGTWKNLPNTTLRINLVITPGLCSENSSTAHSQSTS